MAVREFAGAFDGLHARAYRVAHRLLGSRAEAEDVASEALARAYLAWPRIAEYADAWVSRVAANLAVDTIRKRRRHQDQTVDEQAAPDPYVDRRLDLYRALRSLSRRQREVVVLRFLGDLSEQDVATALQCSVGTVKTHASRGLATLRLSLGDAEAGG